MTDLSVHALSVAATPATAYRPLAETSDPAALDLARLVAAAGGPPVGEQLLLPVDPATDVAARALTALLTLGRPVGDEPLFLVRSGPARDHAVAELGRLVHDFDWPGAELGLTHLDELGGLLAPRLLDWAIEDRATVLLCDDPTLTARAHPRPAHAVALRVRRGPGPLRLLDSGEGPPPAGLPGTPLTGTGPCDSWLALAAALAGGQLATGERLLMHTRGPHREGWLALAATDPATLRFAPAPRPTAQPVGSPA
ncbi:hypothetical protein RM844_13875 [Streptomyces sp. DSM 44915]|uniref:Uncharacterized protein n=1 Tax=Streptomyces chisholmiae TaxID=3075540 RepID=A0ABU2JQW8_9ACTN|nr:hypothetical protein [Streptomyces sp. DSM 44915]MDT0267375.1 hypothetical protein [Streptomyces sp. DSM 44915]